MISAVTLQSTVRHNDCAFIVTDAATECNTSRAAGDNSLIKRNRAVTDVHCAGIVVDSPAKTAENRAGGSVPTYRAIGHVHCPSTVPNTAAIVADRVASGSIIGNRAVADIDRAGTCVLNTAAEAAIAEGVYVTYREVGKAHRA